VLHLRQKDERSAKCRISYVLLGTGTFLFFNQIRIGTSGALSICAVGRNGETTLPSGCNDSRDVG
jgi:hypothetical protein